MTVEWLYESLVDTGNIDLTVIATGYFKAGEQVMFSCSDEIMLKKKEG